MSAAMPSSLQAIRAEADRRSITRVCHFTQTRKLAHILSSVDGILSNARLRADSADVFDANDPRRLDNRPNDINCSVEYPNTWMLDVMKDREKFFQDWIVLILSRDLLWAAGTEFSDYNAASASSVIAAGEIGFTRMFADRVSSKGGHTRSRPAAMLLSCPTDDQAEVLIPGQVRRASIIGAAVPSKEAAIVERRRLSVFKDIPKIRWFVVPAFFDRSWSSLVRQGKRPVETDVTDEPFLD
jgi:hypothetical protein